jgi:phenylpropionate dioxygenase-like ring-hydroxylating dioxygenase large terminal subunit
MDPAKSADIPIASELRRLANEERERREYPANVPILPPIPTARYYDPVLFQLEREHVFGKSWLLVGHTDELREPGDVVLLDQLSAPALLVLGTDRKVRAFYNTCSHRGGPLVLDAAAQAGQKLLLCRYHNWSYDLTGRLRGVTDRRSFATLDTDCLGLRPIQCATWAGLIFVNLDPNARPLSEHLAPMVSELESNGESAGPFQTYFFRKVRKLCRANWKLAMDANVETYHLNILHKDTAGQGGDVSATAISLLPGWVSRLYLPLKPEGAELLDMLLGGLVQQRFHGVGGCALSYVVPPNLEFTWTSRCHVSILQPWPVSPGELRYDIYFLIPEPKSDLSNQMFEGLSEVALRATQEDLDILPFMQASLEGGALKDYRVSSQERAIYYFHQAIDRLIGEDRIPAPLRVQQLLGIDPEYRTTA